MELRAEPWIAARYEILGLLGAGGMGLVYKAQDRRLDRVVALKLGAPRLVESAAACERSMLEARAIAALNHPNIATIFEVGESAGAPVLVLEYLPGGTLRSRIDARTQSAPDIIACGLEIADGLSHAHRHGVVHGDVKPENLMFTDDGRLKITDFGVARFTDERTVAVDQEVAGTVKYLAPECLRGSPADCRTDIYSLGVVLEEMAAASSMPDAFRSLVECVTLRDPDRRPSVSRCDRAP